MNTWWTKVVTLVRLLPELAMHLRTQARDTHTLSPKFVARELRVAFRQHLGTAVAVVVTATLSLAMLGGALLLHAQIDDLKGAWYDKTQVAAYLTQEATSQQVDAIRAELAADGRVARVWFEDHELAYQNFAEQFTDSPEMVAEVSLDQLPESFRIKLVDPADGAQVVTDLTGFPGVRQVVDEHAQLATLFDVLTGFQRAALLLALIQAFAAVVLISNMLRSALTLRSEELAIGRMMGATRTQLALPFVVEVCAYGTIGTAAATGLLAWAKFELVDNRLAGSGVLSGIVGYVGWGALWATIPWLLATGVLVPALVSAWALRRHLHR